MENKIVLNQEQIDALSRLPEQGMGYQIVDVILNNGDVLNKRIVLNSTYLKLNETESFKADDIKRIELHKEPLFYVKPITKTMLIITENIEDKIESYKDWYKEMDTLVNEHFDTTKEFENSITIGEKFVFNLEKNKLPKGLTIPDGSKITLEKLSAKTLVITGKSTTGDKTIITAGIRSARLGD